jgi:co-chaperonin GroES (HSP10)
MIRPMPGWVLCKTLPHVTETAGGLILPKDIDDEVTSEGVAEVIEVRPKENQPVPFGAGDMIVYRGFLRFCNQLGDYFGESRSCEYFMLNIDDALAVVTGPVSVGLYNEYEVPDAKE